MFRFILRYRKYISLFFLLLIFVNSGCVTVKKEAYLRNSERNTYSEYEYEYKLQVDDIISVNISSITPSEYNFFSKTNEIDARIDPILSGFLVDKRGEIHLPVIGSVEIIGLSLVEAQDKIQGLAAQYLDEPTVFIRLINFKFTLLGEVKRESTFTVYDSDINVLQAIGMAGGLTEFADRSQVRLIRTQNDITNTYRLDLLDESIIESEFYKLKPGDIIFVDPLKTKNYRRNSSANIALILSGIATIATVILAFDRIEN